MAGNQSCGGGVHLDQGRVLGFATVHTLAATGLEVAAVGGVEQVKRVAGDAFQAHFGAVDGGERAHQALGVWVFGVVQDLFGVAQFDQFAGVHDADAVGDLAHQAQVVGDEQDGKAELVFQLVQFVHDVAFDDDVEGGGRFVHDDQFGAQDQGDGNDHALTHAAGQLVRIGLHA